MRPPIDPEHRNIVNYKGRGMTERARKKREKNPMAVGGRNLDYRFGTKFHQDYYASAIIKKDYPIACSEYIDWGFL
jgi:ribosomal protein L4